jgi:ABC-type tungstate transport system substrate-binding protein
MSEFVQAFVTRIALIGSFDPEIMQVVGLSLRVSLSASIIAMVIGAPLAGALPLLDFLESKQSSFLPTRCLACRRSWLDSRSILS